MSTTIRDVAKLAGVGLGTVSRVINQSPQVSDKTRQLVLQAIEELDFHPSPIARRLSLKKTLTIAAVAPFFTRPSTIERLRGVELTISGTEYDLIIFNVETTEHQEAVLKSLSRGERVDGVLLLSVSPLKAQIERFQSAEIPIVLVDVNDPLMDAVNRVTVDDEYGGWQAVTHLIELGHRRVAYISVPLDDDNVYSASNRRYEGYLRALHEAGIPADERFHVHGDQDRYEARELTDRLLNLPNRPTAIFAASDTRAIGVLQAVRERGLRIPEDLSVVGYDDIEVAGYLGLTTIRQLLYESGVTGVRFLLDVIRDPTQEVRNEEQPTQLMVRSTTGPSGKD